MIKLGVRARVKGTGFEGIIGARAVYLYGPDKYEIVKSVTSNGIPNEAQWVDEGLLEVIGDGLKGKQFAAPGASDEENKRANEMVGT